VPFVVQLPDLPTEAFERDARQQAWRERSAEKLQASRRSRLDRLRAEHDAVRRALSEYARMDTGNVPLIAFRQISFGSVTPAMAVT
jgi:hypothetical protein